VHCWDSFCTRLALKKNTIKYKLTKKTLFFFNKNSIV